MSNLGRAIKPEEIADAKRAAIPAEFFDVLNELIAKRFSKGYSYVSQHNLMKALESKGYTREQIAEGGWLEFEPVYQAQGWLVTYSRPAYNESGEAHWRFQAK